MKYQDFLNYIKEQMTAIFEPETAIYIESIKKNNGITLEGLIIRKPGTNISPAIYLNPYYHQYLEGISLNQIVQDILFLYHKHIPSENFNTSDFGDFTKIRPYIIFKLVNYEKNLSLLKDVPHIRYMDLAILFQFMLPNIQKNHATILIHNQHLDYWKVTKEELYSYAKQNTPLLLPSKLDNLSSLVNETLSHSELNCPPVPPMYILTNNKRIAGAATILYDGLLGNISRQFNQNLIILPSSIHEVLIVPTSSSDNLDFYSQMVQDVNTAEVSDDEILSNHAYYFSKEAGKIIF